MCLNVIVYKVQLDFVNTKFMNVNCSKTTKNDIDSITRYLTKIKFTLMKMNKGVVMFIGTKKGHNHS